MHSSGAAMVAVALLLSFGGVGYRSTQVAPSLNRSQIREAPTCRAPHASASSLAIDLSKLRAHPGVVTLNTQGYNYSARGEVRPFVPSTRSLRPEGVPGPTPTRSPASPARD